MQYNSDRITHTMAFVTPVKEHWVEQEIDQWVHLAPDMLLKAIVFCKFEGLVKVKRQYFKIEF